MAKVISLILAYLFAISLAVDARLSIVVNVLPAELILLAWLLPTIFTARLKQIPARSALLIALFLFLIIVATAFSSDFDKTVTTSRQIILIILVFFCVKFSYFTERQTANILLVFLLTGCASAILGIAQALVGLESLPNVFNLGWVERFEGGTNFALWWKMQNLQNSGMLFQQSLAIGLHQYSNNFAEYMVYSLIALLTLARFGRIRGIAFYSLLVVIFAALFFSQSRTCQAGSALITIYYFVSSQHKGDLKRILKPLLVIGIIAASAIFAFSTFGYDSLGTVSGRNQLNMAGLSYVFSGVGSVLFGGDVGEYYALFRQDPHNIWIYLALFFGVFAASMFVAAVAWFLALALMAGRGQTRSASALHFAFVATNGWFLLYGLTWSVISVALAGMTWAFLVGLSSNHVAFPQLRFR